MRFFYTLIKWLLEGEYPTLSSKTKINEMYFDNEIFGKN